MVSLLIYAVLFHGIALNEGINTTVFEDLQRLLYTVHASLVTHEAYQFLLLLIGLDKYCHIFKPISFLF